MDSVTNTSDLAAQTQLSSNSLLSLLNGNSGDSQEAQLFANFMAQNHTFNGNAGNPSVTASNLQLAAATQAPTVQQNIQLAAPASSTTSMLSMLKTMNTTLHDLMEKLQNQNSGQSSAAKSDANTQSDSSTTNTPSSNNTSNAPAANATPSYTATHQGKGDKNSDTISDTNSTAATDPSTTAAATAAAATVPPSYIATTSGNSASGVTGIAANDQPSIADLLSQMERLAQMIEKQLQGDLNGASPAAGTTGAPATASTGGATVSPAATAAANLSQTAGANLIAGAASAGTATANGADASTGDTNASGTTATTAATTGPLSLAQALTDLLVLAQLAMKQLDGGSTATGAAAGANTGLSTATGSASSAAPSDAQLMAQLKSLLNNLKADIAANDETGTAPALQADATAATAASAASAAAVSNLAKNADGPVISATKDNWIENENFFNIFSGHDRPTSSPTATNVTALTTGVAADGAGSKDGASLDMDLDTQTNNNAVHSTASLSENATASAALEGSAQTNPYSFASQLSATRATATMGATGLPTAVEQVIMQLSRNVKSGNDQISLQLNPGDLGRVNIKLDMSSDGKVQGTVVADNPTTLGLLQKDVRSLERALQDAGLRADPGSLQFSLGNQAGNTFGQSAGNSSGQTSNQTTGGDSQSGTTSDLATNLAAVSSDTAETYYLTPGRVNLRV